MSDELFVDGICDFDDEAIRTYFTRLNFRIKNYESHRHRPTNSCCFAIIQFESCQSVNAILHQRPHRIDNYTLFVKRVLPPSTCSFIERLLPATSLFVYDKFHKNFDEEKFRKYFNTFGRIIKVEHDPIRSRLLIEYDDYDSVDRIFLNKHHLPEYIEIHKNISPRIQSTIEYHGTCRKQQQAILIEEKNKKSRHEKQKPHYDEHYQDLLQKTINELINCKAELRNRDSEYMILQLECANVKGENAKLNQLINDRQITMKNLQQDLLKLTDQYQNIKSQYEELVKKNHCSQSSIHETEFIHRSHSSFSTRLNSNRNQKCLSDSIIPATVTPSSKIQSRIQSNRTI